MTLYTIGAVEWKPQPVNFLEQSRAEGKKAPGGHRPTAPSALFVFPRLLQWPEIQEVPEHIAKAGGADGLSGDHGQAAHEFAAEFHIYGAHLLSGR